MNYEAFSKKLPELLKEHEGEYALMRDGEVVQTCDSLEEAYAAAWKKFGEQGLFSIQEITDIPITLGIYSTRVLNLEQLQSSTLLKA